MTTPPASTFPQDVAQQVAGLLDGEAVEFNGGWVVKWWNLAGRITVLAPGSIFRFNSEEDFAANDWYERWVLRG